MLAKMKLQPHPVVLLVVHQAVHHQVVVSVLVVHLNVLVAYSQAVIRVNVLCAALQVLHSVVMQTIQQCAELKK